MSHVVAGTQVSVRRGRESGSLSLARVHSTCNIFRPSDPRREILRAASRSHIRPDLSLAPLGAHRSDHLRRPVRSRRFAERRMPSRGATGGVRAIDSAAVGALLVGRAPHGVAARLGGLALRASVRLAGTRERGMVAPGRHRVGRSGSDDRHARGRQRHRQGTRGRVSPWGHDARSPVQRCPVCRAGEPWRTGHWVLW